MSIGRRWRDDPEWGDTPLVAAVYDAIAACDEGAYLDDSVIDARVYRHELETRLAALRQEEER